MTDTDDNLRHWHKLSATDPKQTKPFQRPGGFKGTAIKPIWNIMRLTEHFGPIGIGWGTDEPKFNIIDAEGETLVFCVLKCWYKEDPGDPDEDKAYLYGIGGDRVAQKRSGTVFVDDEAYKKAYTDALTNAFMRLGVSADVYMGMFEDSKYLMEVREHYDNTRAIQNQITSTSNSERN
jgi:hypothetical protein